MSDKTEVAQRMTFELSGRLDKTIVAEPFAEFHPVELVIVGYAKKLDEKHLEDLVGVWSRIKIEIVPIDQPKIDQ